jgi:hypothetical protein
MNAAFRHLPTEHRTVAESVYRAAKEECEPGSCPVAPFLERCVAESVEDYLDARITSHLHIFVLRRVRCCIRAGTCDCGEC